MASLSSTTGNQRNDYYIFTRVYFKVKKQLSSKISDTFTFNSVKFPTHDLIFQTSSTLLRAFREKHQQHGNLVAYFKTISYPSDLEVIFTQSQEFWVCDGRKTDEIPKNQEHLDKLFHFVNCVLMDMLSTDEYLSISSHLQLCVCYMLWMFSTPNFYYPFKHVSYTKKNGKKSVWYSCWLSKKPCLTEKRQKQEHNLYKGVSHRKENMIPKMMKEKEEKIKILVDFIKQNDEDTDIDESIHDYFSLNRKIHQYLDFQNQKFVGNNRAKRLNVLYQDLQKITEKINRHTKNIANENVGQLELENGSIVTFKKERKTEEKKETITATQVVEEDKSNLLQQQEEEIPDSWEDLEL